MRVDSSGVTAGAAVNAPPLMATEDVAGGKTAYVKIDLQIAGKPPETAIFAPSYLIPSNRLDVILYLHGHDRGGVHDIRGYLAASYGRLRQGLVSRRAEAVLVAPTLGSLSEAGNLVVGKRLDEYLIEVTAGLREHVFTVSRSVALGVGNLFLACHSGGGAPMLQLALGPSVTLSALRECWGYDCLYHNADVPDWARWARYHANRRLRLFYLENGTNVAKRCHDLRAKGLDNVKVEVSSASEHMTVPLTHWQECLAAAEIPTSATRIADA